MPYIKSYTYVDNDVLTAANHASNEDGLREYVNQEIVAADIAADTLSGEVIALPRFIPTVYTTDFVTKTIQGQSKLRLKQKYAWFTSTTKGQNQVSTTVRDYQSLYDTGAEIYIPKDNTTVMVTVYMKAFAQENSTAAKGAGKGRWHNQFGLQYEKLGLFTRLNGTRQYVFENTTAADSTEEPVKTGIAGNFSGIPAGHRSIMVTRMLTLSAGTYRFTMVVNAKVEKGNVNSQSFTIETFHV
tara:strand:+ start:1429 stop:2154 length:726 start_codon:yes stop_codon:yes gene_type:complete